MYYFLIYDYLFVEEAERRTEVLMAERVGKKHISINLISQIQLE